MEATKAFDTATAPNPNELLPIEEASQAFDNRSIEEANLMKPLEEIEPVQKSRGKDYSTPVKKVKRESESTKPSPPDANLDSPESDLKVFIEEAAGGALEPELNDQMVKAIEEKTRELKTEKKRRGRKKGVQSNKKEKPVSPELDIAVVMKEVEVCLTKMHKSIQKDLESNKQGMPSIEKLRMCPYLLAQLKRSAFAKIFLDSNGLEALNNFINLLPDGSWPLSTERTKILRAIYQLPVKVEHLRSSRIGKTLNLIQASKKEFANNKTLIQLIKDKWSRIICGLTVEYSELEEYERNIAQIPFFTKEYMAEDGSYLGKRSLASDENKEYGMPSTGKPKNLGFSFTVRPVSDYTKKELAMKMRNGKTKAIDRYLSKIKKEQKYMMF